MMCDAGEGGGERERKRERPFAGWLEFLLNTEIPAGTPRDNWKEGTEVQ